MQIGIFKCAGIKGQDSVHPYIQSTLPYFVINDHYVMIFMQVQVGSMVAFCCPQYNERPQLAKVLDVGQNKLKVQWFDGSWSGKWKVYKYKVGRKVMEWVEDVHQSHLVATSGVDSGYLREVYAQNS